MDFFTVTGSHTYADEGSYLYATDIFYLPARFLAVGINDRTQVADAALSLISTASAISFTPGVPLSNLLLATFGDANPCGLVSDFSGTINWGDGTATAATIIAVGPRQFSLQGTHSYAGGGTFPVVIDINDVGGSLLHASTTAVNSVPEPETNAMLLAGLGLLGFVARLRKSKVA